MILVTGGTGFIGRELIRQLVSAGYAVRILIRPSKISPALPRGIPVEVVVSSLDDSRGLLAAMRGVDAIYHLEGGESLGSKTNLIEMDIEPTRRIVEAASVAGIERLIFLSHIGADRASAYPVMKAKGISESFILNSNLDYSIFRTALIYGPGDHFSQGIAFLLQSLPFFFILPGEGTTMLQPIWVEDAAAALVWALDDPRTNRQVFEIGGPEYLSFAEIVKIIAGHLRIRKRFLSVASAYMRGLTVYLEDLFPNFPLSTFWLDYLAVDRTTLIDTLPKRLGLSPARFSQKLDYLKIQPPTRFLSRLFRRRSTG